jgi:uncharacterized protein (TIGR03437 family)
LLFVSPTQVNFQCPDLPAGQSFSITVASDLGASSPFSATMQSVAPGIFSVDGSGKGQGNIMLAGSSNLAMQQTAAQAAGLQGAPAASGDFISIYATGLGPSACAVPLGEATPSDSPCPVTATIDVLIGGANASVAFAGLAPGSVGLYRVDAQIPASVQPGASVPVQVVVHAPGGSTLPSNVVTIAVGAPPVTP